MPSNPAALRVTAPGEYAHTAEGVDRAEELAGHLMDQLVAMTDVARLDNSITASFMLVEVLSMLEVYGGVDTKTAVNSVKHLTAERVAVLRAARDQIEDVAEVAPPTAAAPTPAPAPEGGHTLH